MRRIPVDDDLAAADAKEATEIDHGGPHRARAIDDDVDDPSHILVRRAAHLAAEHGMGFAWRDHGHGGWWHRLLHRRRRILLRLVRARCDNGESHQQ
jgi:hypothetical protein